MIDKELYQQFKVTAVIAYLRSVKLLISIKDINTIKEFYKIEDAELEGPSDCFPATVLHLGEKLVNSILQTGTDEPKEEIKYVQKN